MPDRHRYDRVVPGRLTGEVAIVTGSTSGLGKEIARVFASEGAAVVVTGRDARRGAEVAAAVPGSLFVPADLADDAQRAALVDETVARFGTVTVLVNNAITSSRRDGAVTDLSSDAWHDVVNINLVAAARLSALVIPHMLAAGRGSIVNISSRAAARGTPGLAAYSASKAGLESLARSITMDYARRGIRCNNVRPGYILHESRDADLSLERRQRIEGQHLTRVPTATDVALAVVFLASREAETITGVTIPVDGGSSSVRGLTLG